MSSSIYYEINSRFFPGEEVMSRRQYREMIERHPDTVFMYGEPYIPVKRGRIVVQIHGFDIIAEARERFDRLIAEHAKDPINQLRRELR